MGQKVHPLGFRLGIFRGWDARWFAHGKQYASMVKEDLKIRKYLDRLLENAEVARVEIEKAGGSIRIVIHSSRPGSIIGRKGQEIESIRTQLAKLTGKNSVEVSVQEVSKPELDATLVAKNIAAQLVKRGSYKRAMKRAALSTMKGGAKGVKVRCAGRLNGAEIARAEWTRVGSVPLHTLRSDVAYGFAEAMTTYGIIGVKVWVCRGDFQRRGTV